MQKSSYDRHAGRATINEYLFKPWLYFGAITIILTSNTLYGRLEPYGLYLNIALVLYVAASVIVLWIRVPIDRTTFRLLFLWLIVLLIILVCICVSTGKGPGRSVGIFFVLAGTLPFFLYLLNKCNMLDSALRCIVNCLVLLTIIALVLWVAGPLLGAIEPNCAIRNNWNGLGVERVTRGYYGLLYRTQSTVVGSVLMLRNTGIFVEAPMHSFALSVGLIIELFLVKSKPRAAHVCILSAGIITSVSITGYILLVVISIVLIYQHMPKTGAAHIASIWAITILVIIGLCFSVFLFNEKLLSYSTNGEITRIDDFAAGYRAWQDSPVYGNGLSDNEAMIGQMSSFRANDTGTSNSPMVILARGGVLFLLVYLIPFIGWCSLKDTRLRMAGVLILYLWVTTAIWYLPLMALLLSQGLCLRLRQHMVHGQ